MNPDDFGPAKTFVQPVYDAYQKGTQFLQHPGASLRSMFLSPQQATHQQDVDQMNREINSHRNDPANQSFIHNQLAKPIGALRSKMGQK